MVSVEGVRKFIGTKGAVLGLVGLEIFSSACVATAEEPKQIPVGTQGGYTLFKDGSTLHGLYTAEKGNLTLKIIRQQSRFDIIRVGRNLFSVNDAFWGRSGDTAAGIGYLADKCEIISELPNKVEFNRRYLIQVKDEACIPELAAKPQ